MFYILIKKLLAVSLIFALSQFIVVFNALALNGSNEDQYSTSSKVDSFFNSNNTSSLRFIPGEILVKYKRNIDENKQVGLKKKAGVKKRLSVIKLNGSEDIFKYKVNIDVNSSIKDFRNNPNVEKVEPNYIRKAFFTPNDPSFSKQWGLNNTGQSINGWPGLNDADIDAPEAWNIEQGFTNQTKVAVVDSGIDSSHRDLSSNIVSGYNFAGISQYSGNIVGSLGYSSSNQSIAQSIKGTGDNLTKVGIEIQKIGNPSGSIIISLRQSLTGSDLASFTILPSEVSTGLNEIMKNLSSSIPLVSGTNYYIAARTTNNSITNFYGILRNGERINGLPDPDYVLDPYKNGSRYFYDGSNWSNVAADDLYFHTNSNAVPYDDNGHGTHVSGIVAAISDNGIGISGVAPGATIMPIKVLDSSGSGDLSDVIAGINYAADNGADIINLSIGGADYSSLEQDAINYAYNKGVTIFAAVGNDGDSTVNYPAGYNNVIGVASTYIEDDISDFSNFNSLVDIAAPGEDIYSTTPTYPVALNSYGYFTSYDYLSGTSMATPYAAGEAALLLSNNSLLTPLQVQQKMQQYSEDLGSPGRDDFFGYGRINAYSALTSTMPGSQVPVATIDSVSPSSSIQGQNVVFSGHGLDYDGIITGYSWRSDINGTLSSASSFQRNNLTIGNHTIYFKVRDNNGQWSTEVSTAITVNAPPTPPAPPATPSQTILSTLLSLKASPKAITVGKAVTIKGQLKGSNGAPVAGKRVTIKANGKVIKTVTTNTGGSFSFKHKPKKNTTYQATFTGDGGYSTSSSKGAKVKVKKVKMKKKKK